jgi:acetyl-CoA synthetase (ADP-forming)
VRDYTLRVAPIAPIKAEEMMGELRISRILKGYRGTDPYDTGCLRDLIVKMSGIMLENPSINQMEINPFFLYSSGGAVVDARVLLG